MLTAGAVAAAPLDGLALAAPGDPIDIRLGVNERFARVEFAGPIGSRARIRREGNTVVVRVGSTAAPDVALLRVNPPRGVASVETRAVQSATEIVLTLADGADARFGQADGAAYVNIFPPGQSAEAPGAPAETVAVGAEVHGGVLTLDFDWRTPTPAAVFRRGDAVWVVFDASARLDLETPPDGLGPASGIRWVRGGDFTAVRIAVREDVAPVARSEGGRWIVTLGGEPAAPEAAVTLARDDDSGPTGMTAAVPGATRVLWIQDPTIGDRIGVVTARGPSKGLEHARRLVDLTLLPTAQGLALIASAEDLRVAVDGDLVRIGRPGGLHLSAPTDGLQQAAHAPEAPRAARLPALIDAEWADLGQADFGARYRQLQTSAAEEMAQGSGAPVEARLALARFLVGSGLHYEAIGVINALVQDDERMGGLAEARGLRGAARAAIGRLSEAQADFASGPLTGDTSAAVWRGYIASRQGEWEVARRAFSEGARAVDGFPAEWRTRFAVAHAEAALGVGDRDGARALIDYALNHANGPRQLLEVRLVQARLLEESGDAARAQAVYQAIARAPFEDLAVPASLHATRLGLAAGSLTPAEAVRRMEPLRWRWRGDAAELQVIRTLGGVYLSQGRYREALEVLRGAGTRMPDLPQAAELQADLSNAFRALFLEGAADGLQPIQAVALFEDFRELTPPGAEGDDMVRRLSRRLVDLDLLDRAAALLEYQVEHRLDGVAKASVATDAAAIRLMNREPQKALENLWGSRSTLLPTALQAERRALEARALMMLGRYDHALEVLASDASPAAQAVRADILWRQQDWAGAAALYEAGLGARWENETRLSAAEETQVTRAGIGYSLAREAAALARLNQRYGRFIEEARSPAAMRLALAPREDFSGLRDAERLAQSVDTFTGWVSQARARFRERTEEPRAEAA
ncbi:hypothetical protein [Brevundimonas sp.]|uniref:hypothetical protein n=1 Tax=Brevundimonas sp. TaxID=1871086 RepID=UPI0025E8A014|nr:hypothetical protein [Brevundimonas sp.]